MALYVLQSEFGRIDAPFTVVDTVTVDTGTSSTSERGSPPRQTPSSSQLYPSGQPLRHVAPQTFSVPAPPQVSPSLHSPQASVPPQASSTRPHKAPTSSQVFGTHELFGPVSRSH